MNEILRDLSGQLIHEGHFVVYAGLWSRSAVLKFGWVREVKNGKISATTVDRDWKDRWNVQRGGGRTTLGHLDRVVVIDFYQLPLDVQEIFSKLGCNMKVDPDTTGHCHTFDIPKGYGVVPYYVCACGISKPYWDMMRGKRIKV